MHMQPQQKCFREPNQSPHGFVIYPCYAAVLHLIQQSQKQFNQVKLVRTCWLACWTNHAASKDINIITDGQPEPTQTCQYTAITACSAHAKTGGGWDILRIDLSTVL